MSRMLNDLKERQERLLGKIYLENNLSLNRLNGLFDNITGKYGIDDKGVVDLLTKRQEYITIPTFIFLNELSPLESVIMYLTVKYEMTPTKIGRLLNRDHSTIWFTLQNGLKKMSKGKYRQFLERSKNHKNLRLPLSVFASRKVSIMENMCIYIKDRYDITYHAIADLLGRNDRTIWTVVNRGRKKLKK